MIRETFSLKSFWYDLFCLVSTSVGTIGSPFSTFHFPSFPLSLRSFFFRNVYSNHETSAHLSLRDHFGVMFCEYYDDNLNDSIGPFYLSWSDMLNVMAKMKIGKSSAGLIKPEHIIHGSTKPVFYLHLLFNSMIQHGIVVTDFSNCEIIPIVKDSQGDVSDSLNYRGITLGVLFSKLFEIAINEKISPYLMSDQLQFGFKGRTSTSHALYILRSTVDYYTSRGSNVYVTSLDCSKAFDRISHHGLFIKLIERKIPLCLLLILIYWHLNMFSIVKWGNSKSDPLDVPLGTKQGGISSPQLFSIYIDDMIKSLHKKVLIVT